MEEIVLKKEMAVMGWICYRISSIYSDLKKDSFVTYEKKEYDLKRKEEALNKHILLRLVKGICFSSQSLKTICKQLFKDHNPTVIIEWDDKDFDDMLDNNPLFKKIYESSNIYTFNYNLSNLQSILLPLLLSFDLNIDSLTDFSDLFGLDIYSEKIKRKD